MWIDRRSSWLRHLSQGTYKMLENKDTKVDSNNTTMIPHRINLIAVPQAAAIGKISISYIVDIALFL